MARDKRNVKLLLETDQLLASRSYKMIVPPGLYGSYTFSLVIIDTEKLSLIKISFFLTA